MRPRIETEKNLDKHIKLRAERHGGKAIKIAALHNNGLPDRLILLPYGRAFFIEVKGKGLKPTRQQAKEHKDLRALHFDVYVVDSFETLDGILPERP